VRNKIILLVGVFILGIALIYFVRSTFSQFKPAVRSIDNKGIYVGNGKSGLEPVPDEARQFAGTVKALNEGWENVRLGNSYDSAGQYEEAMKAY